ncbi:MAG: enoyl-CoA hydratase-related protein [Chloroflexota bacterium]|nr:enoyl-CoA hydratase-related protein [Chloroflexota bacterium]
MVSRVVPLPYPTPTVTKIAEAICEQALLVVRATKESAIKGIDMTLEQGLALEFTSAEKIIATEDAREGTRAFAEKRKPQYKGKCKSLRGSYPSPNFTYIIF